MQARLGSASRIAVSMVHQASCGASASDGQRQNGDAPREPRLTSASACAGLRMDAQRHQRAEMLARELGVAAGRVWIADGDGVTRPAWPWCPPRQLAPDTNQRLRPSGPVWRASRRRRIAASRPGR